MEVEGTRLRYLASDTLRPDAAAPLERRLAWIAAGLRAVLAKWQPRIAAVEDVFVKANPRAALAIGQARGAILAVLGEHEIAVHSYPPATIKKALTGSGRATKDRVAIMVGTLLGTRNLEADESDALATALTHAFAAKAQLLTEQ